MDTTLDEIHEIVMLPSTKWTYVKHWNEHSEEKGSVPFHKKIKFPFLLIDDCPLNCWYSLQ